MKYLITESQIDLLVDKTLTLLLEPHEEKEYPDSVFWIKNGKKIAVIVNEFFFLKKEIGDLISETFFLKPDEIQAHIKKWLDKHYNLGELTPYSYDDLTET